MNRNSQSRFSRAPQIDIKRSIFDRSFTHKTTGNVGDLIPFFVDEMLPGDTFTCDTAFVARMTTPLKPVMDNSFIDIYYFSVPIRLLWEHWKEFNGENNLDAWTDDVEYTIPQVTSPSGGWQKGTIADYMGIPINVENLSVSALPFRAYALIWNEWFRDQNVQSLVVVSRDDAVTTGNNGDSNTNPNYAEAGGKCLKVNKFHDYFTSALPEPQKGDPVTIGIGGTADVTLGPDNNNSGLLAVQGGTRLGLANRLIGTDIAGTAGSVWDAHATVSIGGASVDQITVGSDAGQLRNVDLVADLSQATAIAINELRLAFATQRLLERDARGGTRYTEVIRAHFGVSSPDSRLQRPEYLGGKRVPVNMNQVLQTSEGTENSPQGNTAAYSLTSDASGSFTYSATEHCYIIGLACVRAQHSYQQGIERMWSRKRRFDFYWPALANIGETAILNKEIYAQGTAVDDEAFGYQEAWADYRYKPDRISGAFRSTYTKSLDVWHYGDDYAELPTLSSDWMKEPLENVDRTLAVQSSTEDQMIFDFAIKLRCARPMPIYSIPGLIDHN